MMYRIIASFIQPTRYARLKDYEHHPGERRGLHIAARVKINFRHKFVRRSIVISFTNLLKIYESVDRIP